MDGARLAQRDRRDDATAGGVSAAQLKITHNVYELLVDAKRERNETQGRLEKALSALRRIEEFSHLCTSLDAATGMRKIARAAIAEIEGEA